MRGTFALTLITVGNATDFYAISDVNWSVSSGPMLNGSGTFAAGPAPFNPSQHMSLDLTISPATPPWTGVQHFDTTTAAGARTVAPPVISIQLANSETGCPGVRVWVVASRYRSDWDASGTISVTDIFGYLNAWFAGSGYADFNASNTLEVQDIFDFLGAWFAGI